MFCKNCGKEIPDNATFCTYCGAQTGTPQQQAQQPQQQPPVYQQPAYQQPAYQQPTYQQPGYAPASYENPEGKSAATAALVWGIVAMVFGWIPLGFIFGIVGIKQSKKANKMGVKNGLSVTGLVLSIIGVVYGSIVSVYWIWALILLITVGTVAGLSGFYY